MKSALTGWRLTMTLSAIIAATGLLAPATAAAWDDEVEGHLREHLSEGEIAELEAFFGSKKPLPGPLADDAELGSMTMEAYRNRRIARAQSRADRDDAVRVTPDAVEAEIDGSGTRDDPWRGLIAAALDEHADAPALVIPAGYYQEIGLEADCWLVGEEGAVLLAPPEATQPGYILRTSVGVLGLELDGSQVEYDPETINDGPAVGRGTLHGIVINPDAAYAEVIGNRFYELPGSAVTGRDAHGSHLVMDNQIDRVTHVGIRTGTGWLVISNHIRHAGILRGGPGALGSDAICVPRGSEKVRITHNFILAQRDPNGRHGICTHNAHNNVMEHNVLVTIGEMRGGIRFSDRSDHNTVRRNLVLGVSDDTGRLDTAIRINGAHNRSYGNAVYFANRGINNVGWPATTHNTTHGNRVAAFNNAYSFGLYDEQRDNQELDPDEVRP